MPERSGTPDIIRIMFAGLFIGILMIGSFWVLKPFISAIVWATMIVIPTWPLMLWMKGRLWGSRTIAVLIMILFLSILVFVPVWLVIRTIIANTDTLEGWTTVVMQFEIPPAPSWISGIPVVGDKITASWSGLAVTEQKDIMAKLTPYFVNFVKLIPAQLGNAGVIFIHLLLTLIISIILYFKGESAAKGVRAFARRLASDKGDQAVILAAQAVKAVAMGIVVTALVQAAVAWLGFVIAGIPYSILLTAIVFVLSVIQVGAGPVLVPTIIWLYWSGDIGWGTFILIWSILVMGLDNLLRPYLIKRGANLPLLLIFAGVIGGLISFGILGLFLGPVILAVTYTLINAWVEEAI